MFKLKHTKQVETPKIKYVFLEVIRIISIFFVIYGHTEGFYLFKEQPVESLKFYIYLLISFFASSCVQLFFVISGALMLRKR